MNTALRIFWLSSALRSRSIPLLPKILYIANRILFGCSIPPSAKLGEGVSIGYQGLGVVIHAAAVIGRRVEIGAGVVIGGNAREEGAPIIDDYAYIGAGAKILGPIRVGKYVVVGANAVVLDNVPDRTVVIGCPARVVREGISDDYLFHRRTVIRNEEGCE